MYTLNVDHLPKIALGFTPSAERHAKMQYVAAPQALMFPKPMAEGCLVTYPDWMWGRVVWA